MRASRPRVGRSEDRPLQWLERALLTAGVICVGWYLAVSAWALTYQRQAQAQIEQMLSTPRDGLPPSRATRASASLAVAFGGGGKAVTYAPDECRGRSSDRPNCREGRKAVPYTPPASARKGELIGRLEIPRLGFSAAVAHGDDDGTLKVAIGHLPDTPLPWQAGNTGLAGHRDGFFRPLKDIKENDELRFVTPHGEFRYRVRHTNIVRPEDVWVLDPTATPSLTLVTCYPFSYVGNAPQRFVIRAERIDS